MHDSAADAASDTDRVDLIAVGAETHLLKRGWDVDENATLDNFSIIVDGGGRPLSEIFERMKYITRRGETSALNGIEGQQYIGSDVRIDYNSITGSVNTGDAVTQVLASGDTASGTVVSNNTVDDYLIIRDTQFGFETGGSAANIEVDGSNFVVVTSGSDETFTAIKESPFGTFAGGKFFGARGVILENFDSLDTNNVQFIDDGGNTLTPPVTVTFQLTR